MNLLNWTLGIFLAFFKNINTSASLLLIFKVNFEDNILLHFKTTCLQRDTRICLESWLFYASSS